MNAKSYHRSQHGNIENNCHLFHATQHMVHGFPSLRNSFITEEFRKQIRAKATLYGVIILAYVVMPNHYHYIGFFKDKETRVTFQRILNRDFSRNVRKLIKQMPIEEWPKNLAQNPYIPLPIFSDRVDFKPIYSLRQFYNTFFYIFNNPKKWKLIKRLDGNIGVDYYGSSAYDIKRNDQSIVNFKLISTMLNVQDVTQILDLFEKPEEEVKVFAAERLQNWKKKDDEKLLKCDYSKPWSDPTSSALSQEEEFSYKKIISNGPKK